MIQNRNYKIIFDKNGFIVLRNLISKKICKDALKELKNFKNFSQPKKNKDIVFEKVKNLNEIKYFKNVDNYLLKFKKFYTNKILNIASNLIAQNVYFLNMGLHNKPPGSIKGTPPHQDNFYWCRKPSDALTAYIALTDQSLKNGGIGYLPKSHLGKIRNHYKSKIKAFSSYIKKEEIEKNNYVFPKLKIGDVVFHHCKLIHISAGNNSKKKQRKSLAITIYGSNTKLDKLNQKKYLKNINK